MNIWKRLKTEFHFLYKLFNLKYTPRDRLTIPTSYLNYFKNRFFGNYLAKRMPRHVCLADPEFELHILSQRGNIWSLSWAIRSFMYFSGLCPKIIIHSDGTMTKSETQILKSKFSNLEVVSKNEADERIINNKNIPLRIREYRKSANKLLIYLIDTIVLAKAKYVMGMGDDMMFYKKPTEIVDFIHGSSPYDALVMQTEGEQYDLGVRGDYIRKHGLIEQKAGIMMSSFVCRKDILTIEKLNEFFENVVCSPEYYFLEMAGWASIFSQTNYDFIPIETYHIKGGIGPHTVMKHFTSPRRQELYAYGIDSVRDLVENRR